MMLNTIHIPLTFTRFISALLETWVVQAKQGDWDNQMKISVNSNSSKAKKGSDKPASELQSESKQPTKRRRLFWPILFVTGISVIAFAWFAGYFNHIPSYESLASLVASMNDAEKQVQHPQTKLDEASSTLPEKLPSESVSTTQPILNTPQETNSESLQLAQLPSKTELSGQSKKIPYPKRNQQDDSELHPEVEQLSQSWEKDLQQMQAILDDLSRHRTQLLTQLKQQDEITTAMRTGKLNIFIDREHSDVAIEFVYVPAGSFRMGRTEQETTAANAHAGGNYYENSTPAIPVKIEEGFFLSKYEISNHQYAIFLNALKQRNLKLPKIPSSLLPARTEDEVPWKQPVTNLSWTDAMQFCEWTSKHSSYAIRLPTEIEWEYAARGRGNTLFATANNQKLDLSEAKVLQIIGTNTADQSWCGAMDLSGNASEWCLDSFDPDVYQKRFEKGAVPLHYRAKALPAEANSNPNDISQRVHRGGHFDDAIQENWEAATRRPKVEDTRRDYLGFRVVLILPDHNE